MAIPISDCEVRDPRIRRTRQLLQKAMQTLMQSKGIDEISVQDITEAATLNRATFYDHYTDKFALLEAMVAGGFHALLHERNITFHPTCPGAIGAIIQCACDFLTEAHKGAAGSKQNAFEPLMDAAMVKAIRRILLAGMPQAKSRDMVATAASWAICGAVKEWFATPDRVPAKRIVPQVVALVLPMLS